MQNRNVPAWLSWAREIQALSQTGLHFSQDAFNKQRYTRLMGIAAEITALHTELEESEVLDSFLLQGGYATPKVDVRGAVLQEGRILLVQERSDGKWCMPGGWADIGETPSEMVEREVREESGYEVKAERLIGIYDANRENQLGDLYHAYKMVFHCELVGGEATPSEETSAVAFFSLDDVPELSMVRTNARHLTDVAGFSNDPNWTARFD